MSWLHFFLVIFYFYHTILPIVADSSKPEVRVSEAEYYFARNNKKAFSWSDSTLQDALWGRNSSQKQHNYHKRATGVLLPSGENINALDLGEAYKTSTCVKCASGGQNGVPLYTDPTIDKFSTEAMVGFMLGHSLNNQCIFYGRRARAGMVPGGFSGAATQLACKLGKKSIWMLWPYKDGDCNQDFYCITRPCCWLYPMKDSLTIYFENMSRAMARYCTGDIMVMTDDLTMSGPKQGIWWNVERQELIDRGQVNTLVAVDINGNGWTDITVAAGIKSASKRAEMNHTVDTAYYDNVVQIVRRWNAEQAAEAAGKKRLGKRDSCTAPITDEPAGWDFFG